MADGMGYSASISASTLSGSTTTSSHYLTRRAHLSLDQQSLSDTPSADRVYLDRKNLARCVIPSSSDLRGDGTDRSSVFVLFVLVRSPLFIDGASGTRSNKEQILAGMVFGVDIHRRVSTTVDPLFPPILTDPQTALLSPGYTKQVCIA